MTHKGLTCDTIDFVLNRECDIYPQYDTMTSETYRIMRHLRIDPITHEPVPAHLLFEFPFKWNPYTGERTGFDETGPLCFDAVALYQYFYKNRHRNLWHPPQEGYQGYYSPYLGKGQDFVHKGVRHPEKYLFRLPIIDCYLEKNHNHAYITMGPKLTSDEIDAIDRVVQKSVFRYGITLYNMKKLYDAALESTPSNYTATVSLLRRNNPDRTEEEIIEMYNRYNVDVLVDHN